MHARRWSALVTGFMTGAIFVTVFFLGGATCFWGGSMTSPKTSEARTKEV